MIDRTRNLREWFANEPPEWLVPVGDTFAGVAVYERLPEHRRDDEDNRLGLATGNSMVEFLNRQGTLPATHQPGPSWKGAPLVGFAKTFDETVALLWPDNDTNNNKDV